MKKQSTFFTIRVTADENEALQAVSHHFGITKSEWIRTMIRAQYVGMQVEKQMKKNDKEIHIKDLDGYGYSIDTDILEQVMTSASEKLQTAIKQMPKVSMIKPKKRRIGSVYKPKMTA